MRFKADEIASVISNELLQFREKVDTRETGRVLEVGDGIARCYGLSQVITYMAEPYIASGELVEILKDWTRPPLPVHVVYPPNRHLSAKVRAFVDWAAELFAKHPQLQRTTN